MVCFTKTSALATSFIVLSASIEAHNNVVYPVMTYPAGFYNMNSPSSTILAAEALPVPSGQSYSTDSDSNTKAYWTAFNASTYKTLRELAWANEVLEPGATKDCGYALKDGTPQDLPETVQWDGFSHQGPCEVYCDDTRVFQNWNCAVDYPESPASLPYDKAKCEGAAVLSSYWIALHTTPWQMYTACVPLTGSTSTTAGSSDAYETPATPTSDTTAAGPSTAPAPSPTEESTDTSDSQTEETPTTEVKVPTGGAPKVQETPASEKCLVRRRRQ
ncbi:hypothetical protein CCR75_005521 [Bremia lactucae]|uniref:LysM domain-containing protein n=1 Tax=Bremia lactucae TaxID=4779 RepID=A0A976IBT7_BRELC|nr:hypothetical protein CCR75_005521 [Bremia lactucae]